MFTLLLAIIYISFISLGLPDAMLGSAWPVMYGSLHVPVAYAGVISMIISGGTIISSLFSHRLINRIGTGKVTAISVAMTAIALFGFSTSSSFIALCLWALPYGIGGGSVDAALNNYVALHYKSRHMNWLHSFWGVGASIGPYIMGYCLTGGLGWNGGYRMIAIIQATLTAILIFALPLWGKKEQREKENLVKVKNPKMRDLVKMPGAKAALMAFFCYCALEQTAGLWGASYMVMGRGVSAESAAKLASLFYLGITVGRFISGFITLKLSDKNMIRMGQIIMIAGIFLLFLPFGEVIMCMGFILVGMGCAPVYPSLLHETPDNFGKETSQAIMGMQMACAYIGSTLMPPLFGMIVGVFGVSFYPIFLIGFAILMIFMVEKLNGIHNTEVIEDEGAGESV